MKIQVNFTLDIPAASIPALLELAVAHDLPTARLFVQSESMETVIGYLDDNGVKGVTFRENYRTT